MKVKNWKQLQHYKTRRPPWIRLYRETVLDSRQFNELDPKAAKLLIQLLVLASEDPNLNGELPPLSDISYRLRSGVEAIAELLPMLSHWIDSENIAASTVLASSKQNSCSETETETETETDNICPKPKSASDRKKNVYSAAFEEFWSAYPDKTNNSKLAAHKVWVGLDLEDQTAAINSLPNFSAYCRNNSDYRVIHAERYLKHRRFDGFQEPAGASNGVGRRYGMV